MLLRQRNNIAIGRIDNLNGINGISIGYRYRNQ